MLIEGNYFAIKNVDENYIYEILGVYKQCEDFLSLGPVPFASKKMILDDLKSSREAGGVFCGIFVNGEMIGVVDFILSNFDGNPKNAYLSLLMISICHRCKGIGGDVVDAVETEIIKNKSITSILAGVQTNNFPAIEFWKKKGYKIVSGPELMPDTTITFKLKKDLQKVR